MSATIKPTFTIMGSGIGYIGGNYKNHDPIDAAKKAGKALFKKLQDPKYKKYKKKESIRFILRKRDRHSAGKTYAYEVTQIKLKNPITVKRGDTIYTVYYDYKIKACTMDASEVTKMTGGCLTCGIGGTKKVKGGNYLGAEGAEGAEVTEGAEGAEDAKDAKGAEDAVGAKGAVGAEGAVGAVGAEGADGARGAEGAEGAGGAENDFSGGKKKKTTKKKTINKRI